MQNALVAPAGDVKLQIVRKDAWLPDVLRSFNPRSNLGQYVKTLLWYLPRDAALELVDRLKATLIAESALSLRHFHCERGVWDDLGCVGTKVVTTAGVGAIVDAFQNTVELETFNYHGIGTGGTAEAVGDTALVTELTTEYVSDGTRATGTQGENGANVYQTVATNTVDAAVAITEHGIFTQATVGGVLLDRTLFAVVNLGSGDSLQSTYEITFTAGS